MCVQNLTIIAINGEGGYARLPHSPGLHSCVAMGKTT